MRRERRDGGVPGRGGDGEGVVAAGLGSVNRAMTVVGAVTASRQGSVPLHAPSQPANCERAAGVAMSVTVALALKPWRQSVGQSMPGGSLVTRPRPSPITVASMRTV